MMRAIFVFGAGLTLAGCAAPQSRYEWGSYEEVVYASYLSHDDVPAEKQVELLEKWRNVDAWCDRTGCLGPDRTRVKQLLGDRIDERGGYTDTKILLKARKR